MLYTWEKLRNKSQSSLSTCHSVAVNLIAIKAYNEHMDESNAEIELMPVLKCVATLVLRMQRSRLGVVAANIVPRYMAKTQEVETPALIWHMRFH